MTRPFDRRTFLAMCAAPLAAPGRVGADAVPPGYSNDPLNHAGITLNVWRKGTGPLVFLFHDIKGIGTSWTLADDLVSAKFSVAVPEFFGGALSGYAACLHENHFSCYNNHDHGRIVPWIKALALRRSGSRPFGVIGNCITGILPLLMLRSSRCVAPVLCQPAIPLGQASYPDRYETALALPRADLEFAALRTRRSQIRVLGVRFEKDGLCPPQRFESLERLLGNQFEPYVLCGKGHTTLLGDRNKKAVDKVTGFLKERLMGSPPTPSMSVPCEAPL